MIGNSHLKFLHFHRIYQTKDLSTPNTLVIFFSHEESLKPLLFCEATLILCPHGIKDILIKHIAWHFITSNLKMIKHFIMVIELSTLRAFTDTSRKDNYLIILELS